MAGQPAWGYGALDVARVTRASMQQRRKDGVKLHPERVEETSACRSGAADAAGGTEQPPCRRVLTMRRSPLVAQATARSDMASSSRCLAARPASTPM